MQLRFGLRRLLQTGRDARKGQLPHTTRWTVRTDMNTGKPVKSKASAARWDSDYIADVMRALGIECISSARHAGAAGRSKTNG
jgi:hypothetical protein